MLLMLQNLVMKVLILLGHIESTAGQIHCPNLKSIGLGRIADISDTGESIKRCFWPRMAELSTGKDTTSGHWGDDGASRYRSIPNLLRRFPERINGYFHKETGCGYLGNEVASGTEIIERLGAEHIKTGKPIVYTSADSVFQIAAHEDVIPIDELYRICQITRDKVCIGDYYVGRIIARPFVGELGSFVRTSNRHDYSRMPEKRWYLKSYKMQKFNRSCW